MGGRLSFLALILGLSLAANAKAQTPAGEYVGVLHHDALGRDQLAKLDLIASRDKSGSPKLIGILTLWFGDFRKHEYISFHFEDVASDPAQNQLVLDQADQSVSVYATHFDGVTLDAEVRNVWTVNLAHLHLTRDGAAQPTFPLIEPVEGRYQATCQGTSQTLDLKVYRYAEDTTKIGSAFSSYNIVGELGETDSFSLGCGSEGQLPCVFDLIAEGSYNFFQGHLDLFRHNPRQLTSCQFHPGGWKCGPCDFLRVSDEMKGTPALAPIGAADPFGVAAAPLVAPSVGKAVFRTGEYQGYLHHEFLDEYQLGSVSVLTYPAPGGGGALRTSVMGRLYFGDISSPEFIIYRFTEEDYANDKPAFVVLKNREADYDAIGQITEISEHALKGIWYSRLFGRVGTFEFRDDHLPTLPASARLMQPLESTWESTEWDLEVETRQGKTPINTDNPYFPNIFDGSVTMRGISAADHITDGSYDFYTGRLGLTTSSGRIWVGDLTPDDLLYLEPTQAISQTVMTSLQAIPFRRSPVQPFDKEQGK